MTVFIIGNRKDFKMLLQLSFGKNGLIVQKYKLDNNNEVLLKTYFIFYVRNCEETIMSLLLTEFCELKL
jgi:hypothetical protein